MGRLIDVDAAVESLTEYGNGRAVYISVEEAVRRIEQLPSAQPEPTRIIPETRAIPSDDDRVSLSEKVTATYYDEEHEEWSQKTVTVRDVLDSVCDEYTVLPSAQPERKTGRWIHLSRHKWIRTHKCDQCGNILDFDGVNAGRGDANFCPNCGADMKGEQDG